LLYAGSLLRQKDCHTRGIGKHAQGRLHFPAEGRVEAAFVN